MQIVKKLPTTIQKIAADDASIASPVELRPTEYFRDSMNELVSAGTRCVTVFDDIEDYKYSTISKAYTAMSPIDIAGCIKNVDWDTLDVTMEIDDVYADPESAHYVKPEDWDSYTLLIRGRVHMEYEKVPSGETVEYGSIVNLFGLDLIKITQTGDVPSEEVKNG